jgi:hypothetical protein
MKPQIITLDFDGTVVTHSFPEIGKDIGADIVLEILVNNGHNLILSTMRCDDPEGKFEQNFANGYKIHSGMFLEQAINWFKEKNIPLWGIQENPTQYTWTDTKKIYSNLIIDDTGLGIPLTKVESISDRQFVNWADVSFILYCKGLLTYTQYQHCVEELMVFFVNKYGYILSREDTLNIQHELKTI